MHAYIPVPMHFRHAHVLVHCSVCMYVYALVHCKHAYPYGYMHACCAHWNSIWNLYISYTRVLMPVQQKCIYIYIHTCVYVYIYICIYIYIYIYPCDYYCAYPCAYYCAYTHVTIPMWPWWRVYSCDCYHDHDPSHIRACAHPIAGPMRILLYMFIIHKTHINIHTQICFTGARRGRRPNCRHHQSHT